MKKRCISPHSVFVYFVWLLINSVISLNSFNRFVCSKDTQTVFCVMWKINFTFDLDKRQSSKGFTLSFIEGLFSHSAVHMNGRRKAHRVVSLSVRT
jgi:hypothetical protein